MGKGSLVGISIVICGVPGAEFGLLSGGVFDTETTELLAVAKTFFMVSLSEIFDSGGNSACDFDRWSLGRRKKLFSFFADVSGVPGGTDGEVAEVAGGVAWVDSGLLAAEEELFAPPFPTMGSLFLLECCEEK